MIGSLGLMNEKQREFILKKLAISQYYMDTQIDEKKELNAGFGRTIKETKKKISAYANALKLNNILCLENYLYEAEYQEISEII